MTATERALMYGPEAWRADAGVEWSHWDLWFALLCVRDHGGDWDGLDAAITKTCRSDSESKWNHLLDLRERLTAVGLSVGELVAEAVKEKGVITRARTRVFKQVVSWRDMTPAMRNPPSLRPSEPSTQPMCPVAIRSGCASAGRSSPARTEAGH